MRSRAASAASRAAFGRAATFGAAAGVTTVIAAAFAARTFATRAGIAARTGITAVIAARIATGITTMIAARIPTGITPRITTMIAARISAGVATMTATMVTAVMAAMMTTAMTAVAAAVTPTMTATLAAAVPGTVAAAMIAVAITLRMIAASAAPIGEHHPAILARRSRSPRSHLVLLRPRHLFVGNIRRRRHREQCECNSGRGHTRYPTHIFLRPMIGGMPTISKKKHTILGDFLQNKSPNRVAVGKPFLIGLH